MANWSEGPLLSYGLPTGVPNGAEVLAWDNKDTHTCIKLSKRNKVQGVARILKPPRTQ